MSDAPIQFCDIPHLQRVLQVLEGGALMCGVPMTPGVRIALGIHQIAAAVAQITPDGRALLIAQIQAVLASALRPITPPPSGPQPDTSTSAALVVH